MKTKGREKPFRRNWGQIVKEIHVITPFDGKIFA